MIGGWLAEKMICHYFATGENLSLCGKVKRGTTNRWLYTRNNVRTMNELRQASQGKYTFCPLCEEALDK